MHLCREKSHQEEDLHTGGTNPLRKPGKTTTGQDAHINAQEEGPNLRHFKFISGEKDEPWKNYKREQTQVL